MARSSICKQEVQGKKHIFGRETATTLTADRVIKVYSHVVLAEARIVG